MVPHTLLLACVAYGMLGQPDILSASRENAVVAPVDSNSSHFYYHTEFTGTKRVDHRMGDGSTMEESEGRTIGFRRRVI